MSSWDTGYGDMMFELDLDTIRLLPHLPGSVMIQTDLTWLDGTPVRQSPRSILRRRPTRAAAAGLTAFAGTELEFIVFNNTYEEAWDAGYKGLTPANQYNVDYSILGTTRIEPLLRDIRNTMYAAGLTVESAKGECNFGQHEIAFRFAEVLTTADNHAVYKNTAKEIAEQHGRALTFMAKFNEREGNSCHIHLSLRGADGGFVFWDDEAGGRTPLYDHFIAGILATMREFTLLYAPNINSYKRFAEGSFAPTTVAWGLDNRTCSVRLVGHGPSARLENRLPGGDVNPVPGDRRRCWPAACTASSTNCRWRTSRSATPTPPASRRCRGPCARPGTCSTGRRWRGPPSVMTWSTTMFMRPTPSWPRSMRR